MKWNKFLTVILLLLAFALSMAVIMPSGSYYCFAGHCGIYFWGAHEHDSVWHLAVINNLYNHIPFQMPNMSGMLIGGYNYLMDIVVASLSIVSRLSSSLWFFKILPITWFGLVTYLSYKFAKTYRISKTLPIFVWIFLFFGSSLSYLLKWQHTGSIWGSGSVLSMQALQNMLNPQFAWSLIPLLLLLIDINQGKRSYRDYFFYGLYVMLAIGLKFYTGTIMLVMIAGDLVINWLKNRQQLGRTILAGLMVGGLALISVWVFYSPGKSTGFPFAFRPWATVNPIIEDKTLFYLPTWAERLYAYHGIKLGILETGVLGIFVMFNFGSRILGLLSNLSSERKTSSNTRIVIMIGGVVSFLLSILFTQQGVWWNTVQFLYVSLFLAGLLAAEGLDKLWESKKTWAYGIVGLTIVLMVPNNLDIARSFVHVPGTGYIDENELSALEQLRELPPGVVLTPVFTPRPQTNTYVEELSRKYDTGYVSAYAQKQTYLSDIIQLELTNIEYHDRLAMTERYDCQILNEVNYIYEYQDSPYAQNYLECGKSLERVIETKMINVYQVK